MNEDLTSIPSKTDITIANLEGTLRIVKKLKSIGVECYYYSGLDAETITAKEILILREHFGQEQESYYGKDHVAWVMKDPNYTIHLGPRKPKPGSNTAKDLIEHLVGIHQSTGGRP